MSHSIRRPTTGARAVAIVLCLAPLASAGDRAAPARQVSFDDRVAAQRALEEVYWRHRIWPRENPAPKPALSSVMSDEEIRAKAEDYLEHSRAIEQQRQRPIRAAELQAELDRMSEHVRPGSAARAVRGALERSAADRRDAGDDERAAQHLQKSYELGKRSTIVDWAYRKSLTQALLKESEGDLEDALDLLDEAQRFYVRTPTPNLRPVDATKACI